MAKHLEAHMKLSGNKELEKFLSQFPARVKKKALKAAVTAGAAPIVKATRSLAKGIKRSGLMAKAVNKVVRSYSNGNAVAIIGASKDVSGTYKGKNRIPSFYWHLVLGGTRQHSLGKGSRLARVDRPHAKQTQRGHGHPGAAANNILEHAVDANGTQSAKLMETKLKDVVEKEAAKLAGKGA